MIETASPELLVPSQISTEEHQAFADIAERLAIDANLVEDADANIALNEILLDPDHDLQSDRIDELKQIRAELLKEFLQQPHDAYMAEVMNYARLCEDRSISWVDDYDGAKVTEFVTTNHENKQPDLHFTIREHADGTIQVTTEVPLRGEFFEKGALPFFIRADNKGNLTVEQQKWERGSYQYKRFTLEPDGQGEDRLEKFFNFSTEAVHLAYSRQAADRQKIDENAKRLLIAKKLGKEPRLAL